MTIESNLGDRLISGIKKMVRKQINSIKGIADIPKLYARDAMIKPIYFFENDHVMMVVKKLKREEYNVCIVVDKNKRLVGEIRDEDLIMIMANTALKEPIPQILNHGYKRDIIFETAGSLAKNNRNTVFETDPINGVLKKAYKCKNLIVLNKNKEAIGVITPSSLLKLLSEH